MKINAKLLCDALNSIITDVPSMKVLLNRVDVCDSQESSLNCSVDPDGQLRSSALGLINSMSDELIHCQIDVNSNPIKFLTLNEKNKQDDELWSKYEADLLQYNLDNGTNHKPASREKVKK